MARRSGAAISRELEAFADRQRIQERRGALAALQARLRLEARDLRASCKVRRVELRDRRRVELERAKLNARALVERARSELMRARDNLRAACKPDKESARATVERARRLLDEAREIQRSHAPRARAALRGLSAAERRAHELDEARAELADPDELAYFDDLVRRRKLRRRPRESMAESFLHELHEHPAGFLSWREKRDAAEVRELERQELAAYRASRREGRRMAADLSDVPF